MSSIKTLTGNSYNSFSQYLCAGSYYIKENNNTTWHDVEQYISDTLDKFYLKDQSWSIEFVDALGGKKNALELIMAILKTQSDVLTSISDNTSEESGFELANMEHYASEVARHRWLSGATDSIITDIIGINYSHLEDITRSEEYKQAIRDLLISYRTGDNYWNWRRKYRNIEGRLGARMKVNSHIISELIEYADDYHTT